MTEEWRKDWVCDKNARTATTLDGEFRMQVMRHHNTQELTLSWAIPFLKILNSRCPDKYSIERLSLLKKQAQQLYDEGAF